MATLEHSRYKVFSQVQHILRHNMSDFQYTNHAAPDVLNVEDALNYIFKVLYPQTKPAVVDIGDLPTTGNTLGDYRNVENGYTTDGGATYKTAGYMWAKFDESDTAEWHMTTVFDWGTNDIASVMIDRTKLLYYFKLGLDDVGRTGDEAGQWLFGGASVDTHLTLNANAGDAAGVHTGFIQMNDSVRPVDDNAFVLGEVARRFKEFYTVMAVIGNVSITGNTISTADAVKIIDFIDNAITTTGKGTFGEVTVDNINVNDNIITSDTGEVSFNDDDITTTGKLTAGEVETLFLKVDTTTIDNAVLIDTTNTFDMNVDLVTFKDQVRGQVIKATDGTDAITVTKDEVTSTGDLTLTAAGIIKMMKDATVQAITGLVATFTKLVVDNITVDGNTISSDNTLLTLSAAAGPTNYVRVGNTFLPVTDNQNDLGAPSAKFKDLFIGGGVSNGVVTMSASQLMEFKDASSGAVTGDCLFYDATSHTWKASPPDTEIKHTDLEPVSLTTDDHLQYVAKAGRDGGQSIHGGDDNTEVLALAGYNGGRYYIVKDTSFAPNDDNTGDLGEAAKSFKDLYLKGQMIGARVENRTDATLTDASVSTIGRMVYSADGKAVYVDNGGAYQRVGLSSYKGTHTAAQLTGGVDVSASIADATNAIWQVVDVDENNEVIYPTITKTATTVTISTDVALPAHNFKLIGVEA